MSEVYFLKTGNWLQPYRGHFNDKEVLSKKLKEVIDKSLKSLVKEWEEDKGRKWERPVKKIIPRRKIIASIQILNSDSQCSNIFKKFFPIRISNKKL